MRSYHFCTWTLSCHYRNENIFLHHLQKAKDQLQSDSGEAGLHPTGELRSPGDAGLTISGGGRDQRNGAEELPRAEKKASLHPKRGYKS